jgi:hypothetical protein
MSPVGPTRTEGLAPIIGSSLGKYHDPRDDLRRWSRLERDAQRDGLDAGDTAIAQGTLCFKFPKEVTRETRSRGYGKTPPFIFISWVH